MILLALAGDHDLIGIESISELSGCLIPGEACCLEEADGSFLCSNIFLLVAHSRGIDRIPVHIDGVSCLITFISRFRCSPGSVGNRILDDGCSVTVVGIDNRVTIDREKRHKAFAESLGSIGSRFSVNVDEICIDAKVAVSAVVNEVGGQGIANKLVVGVCILDGCNRVIVDGRCRYIECSGNRARYIVGIDSFLHEKNLCYRLALEVIRICLEGNNALVIAVKHISAAPDRLSGLVLYDAQVALDKTEAVVVVIVEGFVAVVVQRGNRESHVIDSLCIKLRHVDGHGIVACALNACDVCSTVAGGHADSIGCIVVHQVIEAGTSRLGIGEGCKVAFVSFHHVGKEISRSGILREFKTPVGSAGCNSVICFIVAGAFAVIHDFLCKCFTGLVNIRPECSLGISIPIGKVFIVSAGSGEQAEERFHTGTVLFHTFDRESIKGCRTVIGRITFHIDTKNHVIDISRCTVGENDIITHGEEVVNRAVLILNNFDIAEAVIRIVSAIVGAGLTFNAVFDNSAATVSAKKEPLCQFNDFRVISRCAKERAELLAKGRSSINESGRSICFFCKGYSPQSEHHGKSQEHCQESGCLHFLIFTSKRFLYLSKMPEYTERLRDLFRLQAVPRSDHDQ